MPLTKLEGFTKLIADLPDYPSETMTPTELKQYWDSSPEEVRFAFNRLIEELEASTGAAQIGVSNISGLTGTKLQELLVSLKSFVDVVNSDLQTYKTEVAPYLQGGDTTIRYEVFTIVHSNNGDGTFTYKDKNEVQYTGTLTPEGYQIFTFKDGFYDMGQSRVECIVGDTLHRSVGSGGLQEISSTSVALTIPEGNGAEITFKYFERIGVTGEHNLIMGEVKPPPSSESTMWFKVVG